MALDVEQELISLQDQIDVLSDTCATCCLESGGMGDIANAITSLAVALGIGLILNALLRPK